MPERSPMAALPPRPAGEAAALSPARDFAPRPVTGRVFTLTRPVRGTEVTRDGRLRLDTLARYLQEAAEDDLADAGWQATYGWLLRRIIVLIRGYPALGDRLTVSTFCSATGPRWAERTTTVSAGGTDMMQSRALWVAVAPDGRPCALGRQFHRVYGPAAGGRTVSARLSLPGPPDPPSPPPGGRAWPLRASDFDTAGHVNNAIHWAAVEEMLPGLSWLPAVAELEYLRPILAGPDPRLVTSGNGPDQLSAWLLAGPDPLAAARLTR